MASKPMTQHELLRRLEARHAELFSRLDELDELVEQMLQEFGRVERPNIGTCSTDPPA